MIQLSHLTITHQKDLQVLIDDLTLILHPGDKLAIIGEEGTGKSTLMAYLYDPNSISTYAKVSGSYQQHFSKAAYIPQSLDQESLMMTMSDYLYHDWMTTELDSNQFYQLAQQFHLDLSALEDNRPIGTLSGGEKRKLQFAKTLASQPDLLLLDEPSSDLDLDAIKWLETFIRNSSLTREEHQKQMAKLNQHKSAVRHALTHTKNATAGTLLAKKMKTLLSREQRFILETKNFTDIPYDEDAISLFFSDIIPIPKRKRLIHYEQKLLKTGQVISLTLFGEDKVVITGQNGIGKTRLLKTLYEDLQTQHHLTISYMPQHYDDDLPLEQTPLAFLEKLADHETCRSLLASLRFTRQEITHAIAQLSGGQKAKLYLAAMILQKPNLIILDEPTRHFAPTSQPEVRALLAHYPSTIISVSHDRKFIAEIGTKVLALTDQSLKPITGLGKSLN